ncbi:hypothetical protein Van01_46420 [Micromonospora andamanensis]|uniref:Uncharacterized protein n=1 Tax=Micromonospora andamanensis TaxID=1287068 RepID=A0ABQ4I0I7_9ACTN|nr:hypothetical protein Van01_46420 [Micromonospora andamanensis]
MVAGPGAGKGRAEVQVGEHFRPFGTAIRYVRFDKPARFPKPLQRFVTAADRAQQVCGKPTRSCDSQWVVRVQGGGHSTINGQPDQLTVAMPCQVCLGEMVSLREQGEARPSIIAGMQSNCPLGGI